MRLRRAATLLAAAAALAAAACAFRACRRPPAATGAWMQRIGVPRFETIEGLRIRLVERGRGPAVLLVHGLGSSIYSWSDVLPELAARHRVVALDLPGFGGSEIREGLPPATYPRVVMGVMDRLRLRRASLVGHSLGGAVAAAVAAGHPDRVERLVLVDAAGFNLDPGDSPLLLRLAARPALAAAIEGARMQRPVVWLALRQVFHDDGLVTRERMEEYLAPLARPRAIIAAARLLSSREPTGLPEALARVGAPTLVIWGRQDSWVPLDHADRFVAAIAGARKMVLDGCGHVPQEEQPAALAAAVSRFLGG